MSLQEFDKLFGLSSSIEEEKEKFINRIENGVFDSIKKIMDFNLYEDLFKNVCYILGQNSNNYIEYLGMLKKVPNFVEITKHDFIETLRVTVAVYESSKVHSIMQQEISRSIEIAISKSVLNIGINWKDGIFYPSGESILDKELIEVSFDLLDDYPEEKIDLKNALDNYSLKSLYGVVENCYLAIEGLTRKILNNKKTLIDNKPDLLRLLEFSPYWLKIFANYLNYANEYRRHAGEDRHNLKPSEVEAFLYLSCLIIRATLLTIKNRK